MGEARLWYKSLAPLDDDWPALQNKFRWQAIFKNRQYTQTTVSCLEDILICENKDTIDSYVLRMSQVAAILNYREMHILEISKTLFCTNFTRL